MANAPFPPFVKKDKAPDAAPEAVVVEEKAVKAPKAAKVTKDGSERAKPAKMMSKEQMNQVLSMIKTKSYTEIGEELGITKHQVNRVLMEVKKSLKAAAAGDPAKEAKVDEFIKVHLSRPEETRPGVKGEKGGKVKKALNDIVGDILAGL